MDHASQALKNLNFFSVPLCLVGYRWGRNVGDPTSLAHDNVFNISEAFSLGDRKSKEIHLESDRKNKEIHLESDGKKQGNPFGEWQEKQGNPFWDTLKKLLQDLWVLNFEVCLF